MAEGNSHGCNIIPTKDTHLFHFRVRFSAPEDIPITVPVVSPVVAGYQCDVLYWPMVAPGQILFILRVLPGSNPVLDGAAQVIPHMVFLDKTGSPAPSMGIETVTEMPAYGSGRMVRSYTLLAKGDDVKANCVVDDYIVVQCSIDVIRNRTTSDSSVEKKELPDLGHDLALMLDKQELTDVVFNVDGESFDAHRLVLAARSPVFRAELYGQMTESKMTTSITIQDMRASTFRSMLHYLYHGSLPNTGKAVVSSTIAEYQHLLVAADRYDIEKLKKICEDKLCGSDDSITIGNVVSMLELAEDYICPKLKARCFDFLAEGENFKMVATSGEYLQLMQGFPSLLAEVRSRFNIAHEKPRVRKSGAHKKSRK